MYTTLNVFRQTSERDTQTQTDRQTDRDRRRQREREREEEVGGVESAGKEHHEICPLTLAGEEKSGSTTAMLFPVISYGPLYGTEMHSRC